MTKQVPKVHVTSSDNSPIFSRIVYGIWRWADPQLSDKQRSDLFNECLSHGITTFDSADIYGGHTCEQLFGKILQANPAIRHNIQIVTKCGICLPSARHPEYKYNHYDTTKEHILKSVRQSLEDLNTSYIDLLLIHRPDFLMNPSEVAEAFDLLKKDGLVRHFGVSNFTPSQFDMLSSRLSPHTPLITNQVELSPVASDVLGDGTLDQCIKYKIKPMLWSPLRHLHDQSFDKTLLENTHSVLKEIAASHGEEIGTDMVSLVWGLQHPSQPFTIIGTSKVERIAAAVDSLRITLSREEWFRIWCAGVGRKSVP